MNQATILFQFESRKSAELACDTLEELGYEPTFNTQSDKLMLHVHVEHSDLTSALEIVQIHGGKLLDA